MDLKEIEGGGAKLCLETRIGQVKARDTENAANFLTSLETVSLPRRS